MDVTFIPNEYALKGIVIGHPVTVTAIKSEFDRLNSAPILRTATFALSPLTATSVWLQKVGEEGMEISLAAMEEELQRIFEARF